MRAALMVEDFLVTIDGILEDYGELPVDETDWQLFLECVITDLKEMKECMEDIV
jgi:hypothetical protein